MSAQQAAATLQEVVLASPRGFCAGVDRAIKIVEHALQTYQQPVYVRHEIVHNPWVVGDLRERGAVFVEETEEIPRGAVAIFSAHGVSPDVREEGRSRGLRTIDATCPLVSKVHSEVLRYARAGYTILYIGHRDHPEAVGVVGEAPACVRIVESVDEAQRLEVPDPERVAYATQTTLSVDDAAEIVAALKRRFPRILEPGASDICYATTNRQEAVRSLAAQTDVVLVLGGRNSSNSNRLREVAERAGKPAYLLSGPDDLDPGWLAGARSVGVTAGASTPEHLVQALVARLRDLGASRVRELVTCEEDVTFGLPRFGS
jgi:4-hydroxy-3-methylbut-2-enyl diphosphate reductase